MTCDQDQYGCESEKGAPIKQPTSFLTNALELSGELMARCLGRHGQCSRFDGGAHRQCRGKAARRTAVCDFTLCRAMLFDFRRRLQRNGLCNDGFVRVLDARMEKAEVAPLLHIELGNELHTIEVDNHQTSSK